MQRQIKIMVLIGIIVLVAAFMGASYYQESVQSERRSSAPGNRLLVRPDSQTAECKQRQQRNRDETEPLYLP